MEPDVDLLNYFLSIVGRIGFCLLILTLYRVYNLVASPLVKKRHKKFIVIFGVILALSFVLMALNYIVPINWLSTASLSFNVFITYVFAFYLYYQGNVLEGYKSSDEFINLSSAMDSLILKLKHS